MTEVIQNDGHKFETRECVKPNVCAFLKHSIICIGCDSNGNLFVMIVLCTAHNVARFKLDCGVHLLFCFKTQRYIFFNLERGVLFIVHFKSFQRLILAAVFNSPDGAKIHILMARQLDCVIKIG